MVSGMTNLDPREHRTLLEAWAAAADQRTQIEGFATVVCPIPEHDSLTVEQTTFGQIIAYTLEHWDCAQRFRDALDIARNHAEAAADAVVRDAGEWTSAVSDAAAKAYELEHKRVYLDEIGGPEAIALGAALETARSEPVFAGAGPDTSNGGHLIACYGDHTGPCQPEHGFTDPPAPPPHLVRPFVLVAGACGVARDEDGNVIGEVHP